jgi:RNA polymerase sigma-70 factor (ECF subfamily)
MGEDGAPRSDRDLVSSANRGDDDAFEELYRRHRRFVYAIALRFTGRSDDALDVLQDTFVHLWRQFPGFRLTSTLPAYLYPVAKHRSLTLLGRRRRVVPLDGATGLDEPAAAPDDERGDLERRIAALPGPHREVIRLRFEHDLRLEEIAAALGVPVGTVKSRLHTALRTLRQRAGENPPDR